MTSTSSYLDVMQEHLSGKKIINLIALNNVKLNLPLILPLDLPFTLCFHIPFIHFIRAVNSQGASMCSMSFMAIHTLEFHHIVCASGHSGLKVVLE